jgi:hypothetical protein
MRSPWWDGVPGPANGEGEPNPRSLEGPGTGRRLRISSTAAG